MNIYLAGPDVFRPGAQAWATEARALCRQFGFEALTPPDHQETTPRTICEANLELIRKAQTVVANLHPFRGAEPDSGTVLELGYGLALGKKAWGYVPSAETVLERVRRLQGHAIDGEESDPVDSGGWAIENLGLPLNLMIALSVNLVAGDLRACIA
jgi:nucleoside 2-deoxyribosyltransferase